MVRPIEMRGSQLIGRSHATPRAIALHMQEAFGGELFDGGVQMVHARNDNSKRALA
jgi:hypothetical protein